MNIVFECEEKMVDAIAHPAPASKFIPDWYKKMPVKTHNHSDEIGLRYNADNMLELDVNMTMKRCIPVRDIITAGYIIPMWVDMLVTVERKSNRCMYHWKQSSSIDIDIGSHPSVQYPGCPISKNTIGDSVLKFISPWHIHTPPGYSCLFITPQYHYLDHEILPAIVDTDKQHVINFPYEYKGQDGQFTLQKGSPLIQVIPFKRDNWTHEIKGTPTEKFYTKTNKFNSVLKRFYAKYNYSRKTFR